MKTGITVGEAMTQKPITVSPDASLEDCAKIMRQKKVGSLVIKQGKTFYGILTEQDFVRKAAAENFQPAKKKAKDIMSDVMVSITPDKDIFDAVNIMKDFEIRHVPVVAEGELLGLVTVKDILKIEPDLFDILVQKFELREEQRKPVYSQKEQEGLCEDCGEYASELRKVEGALLCENCR